LLVSVYICGPTPSSSQTKKIALPARASLIVPEDTDIQHLHDQAKSIFGEEVEKCAGNTCYLPVGDGALVGNLVENVWTGTGLSCWGITLGKSRSFEGINLWLNCKFSGPGTGKVLAEMMIDGNAISADVSRLKP
jgi:hypothetical protein